MLLVGPPFFCKLPKPAGVLFKSPVCLNEVAQEASSDRLYPCDVIVPAQFPPDPVLATMLFLTISVPPFDIPPPLTLPK